MMHSAALLSLFVFATLCMVNQVKADEENPAAFERIVRAVTQPELSTMVKYWKEYARRRVEALERCETRLYLYSNRRKLAKEFVIVKRNAAADMSDITAAQQTTEGTETSIQECVNQIVNLHGDDSFYREYQYLSSDLQRVTDQVLSCLDAGGHIGPLKREVVSTFDEQLIARSSPQMLRVYTDTKRKKDLKIAEKTSCFESLGIPPNFPVQLEKTGP